MTTSRRSEDAVREGAGSGEWQSACMAATLSGYSWRWVWARGRFNLNGNTICMQHRTRAGRVQAARHARKRAKESKKATMRAKH